MHLKSVETEADGSLTLLFYCRPPRGSARQKRTTRTKRQRRILRLLRRGLLAVR